MPAKYINRWNDARRAMLHRMWFEGTMIKVIAIETGMSAASIKQERARLGLPPRRSEGQSIKVNSITVYFDDIQWAEMKRAAFGRYASLSQYIRAVIARDCGRPRTTN